MVVNEYSPLNNLTRAGIFDYDAEAYLNGVHPQIPTPEFRPRETHFANEFDLPPLQGTLQQDVYGKNPLSAQARSDRSNTMKKVAAFAIASALIIFGGNKCKNGIKNIINSIKGVDISKVAQTASSAADDVSKTTFNLISDKAKAVYSSCKNAVGETFEKIANRIKD